MFQRILQTKLFTKDGHEIKNPNELSAADENNLILVPEIIIPNVSSEEDVYFAGDVVKHTFLEARGGDIVKAEEMICLTRAIEPIYIDYGGTVSIEKIGNIFADIELAEKLPKNDRISTLLWMTGMGHTLAEEKMERIG